MVRAVDPEGSPNSESVLTKFGFVTILSISTVRPVERVVAITTWLRTMLFSGKFGKTH